ncbi:hypothetical protein ICE98_02634 [Lactococcus lactis]|nr:hypothetical protein [Lactococcus lactis]
MNGGMINGNMSTNIGGKHFSTADLPATGEANAGWLSMVGTVSSLSIWSNVLLE